MDNDLCLSGDFNADGKDDIAVLKREAGAGAVMVALAGNSRFLVATKWGDNFCLGGAVCKVGDLNADNRSDLISFQRSTGNVTVLISTGSSFTGPALWNSYFCVGAEICDVGDFNGDNRDDIILFTRSIYGDGRDGDVLVSLNTGSSFLGVGTWHEFFCIESQQCSVGDFNGDRVDDILLFAKSPANMVGQIYVALGTGGSFGQSNRWNDFFCPYHEVCAVGDFDGDGRKDVLSQAREGYAANPITYGDVYVGLSGGNNFLAGQKWHEQFCVPGEECVVGDFNGDGRDDLVRLIKTGAERGAAYVAFASGSAVGFVLTPGSPAGRWADYFCVNQEVCATGDFNGDGLDDILYFVRSTQGGAGEGDVFVALSNGAGFGLTQKWHDYFCVGQDNCQIGDFNNDGADDLVSFSRTANGQVFVALSNGSGFGPSQLWNSFFCPNPEWCEVGDFNGDNLDDVVTFFRNSYGSVNVGRVFVAISNGGSFIPVGEWNNFFCIASEWCEVGDMNGDNRDDIITFTRGQQADVFVGLSTGTSFLPGATPWHEFFCAGSEQCRTGDFNGDNLDDAVTFLRSDYPGNPATIGDVIPALSLGHRLEVQTKWNDFFCINQEHCDVGDFNGDGMDDVIAFTKLLTSDRAGDVFVALKSSGPGFSFTNAPGVPQAPNSFILPFYIRTPQGR